MSQADIERSTGMLRSYISRVEHGRTVPSLESLERFAVALGLSLYELFRYVPEPEDEPAAKGREGDDRLFRLLKGCVREMEHENREFLMSLAKRLAGG